MTFRQWLRARRDLARFNREVRRGRQLFLDIETGHYFLPMKIGRWPRRRRELVRVRSSA